MSELFDECNEIDATLIVERFGMDRARERNKVACVHCSSSDAMHVYRGSATKRPGFKCYSCGKPMSNVDAVMMLMDLKDIDAAMEIAARFNIPTDQAPRAKGVYIPSSRPPRAKPIPAPIQKPSASYTSIWSDLRLGPQAVGYLLGRGINPDCANDMGVRSIESREQLDAWFDSVSREDQIALGLLRHEDGRDQRIIWDAPALVLPYLEPHRRDAPGQEQVVGMRFAPFGAQRERYPRRKYLSPFGNQPPVPYAAWQIQHAIDTPCALWIVEGELNALCLQQIGIPTLATAGASAWRPEWVDLLKGVPRIILAADGDHAGLGWTERIMASASARMGVYAANEWMHPVQTPAGQDINDLSQRGELRAWMTTHTGE